MNQYADNNKKIRFSISDNYLLTNKIITWILFSVFLIVSLVLVFKHEIWLDEAQAWMISKDLSFIGIFKQMRFEGHSCLWHLLLSIFSKTNMPVIFMNLFSWLLVSISIYIVFFHSSWKLVTKVFISFCPTYIYFLSVISRSYSMIPVLLSLFFLLYDHRKKHPFIYTNILGLIAHTHIIMCGFVGVYSIAFIIEYIKDWKNTNKKHFFIIIGILIIYFLTLLYQVLPSVMGNGCVIVSDFYPNDNIEKLLTNIGVFFFGYKSSITTIGLLVIFITIIVLLISTNNKMSAVALIITMVFNIFVQTFWPYVLIQRTCIIYVILCAFCLKNKSLLLQVILIILAVLTTINNYKSIINDYNGKFSDSLSAAKYINKKIKDNSLIIFVNSDHHVSVIPYIDSNKNLTYYNLKQKSYDTYITWQQDKFRKISYIETLDKLNNFSTKYENVYLMLSYSETNYSLDSINVLNKLEDNNKLSLLYKTEILSGISPIFEYYSIYEYIK